MRKLTEAETRCPHRSPTAECAYLDHLRACIIAIARADAIRESEIIRRLTQMKASTMRMTLSMIPRAGVGLFAMAVCLLPPALAQADNPPSDSGAPVVLGPRYVGTLLLADGTLRRFVSEGSSEEDPNNFTVDSTDSGRTWGSKTFAYKGPRAARPLLDRDGEYHVFPTKVRLTGEPRKIAVNYFIDIWHVKTRNGGTAWDAPQRIFEGYVGSVNCVTQLSSGRIVVPFAEWIGGRPTGPPTGANVVTCVYSDDGGETWAKSASQLTAPRHTDFNGSGYGACEPVITELKDGRVYMLARTETGRLYESFSQDGVHWDPLVPSRFLGTDAPANFLRLDDGRLLLFMNRCEKPDRVNGDGVYGGRDALHAAISDDEGKSWRGFREIYRDPTRNESPPKRGDRGTAYPMPYRAPGGNVIVMSGQGRAGATLTFDPDWLLETHAADDFSEGIDAWSVFKHFGPAKSWWRDRAQGPVVIDHPDSPGANVLHIRRPDEKPGDGAVYNFPMGDSGALTLRLQLRSGFGGAVVSLMDRFFNPTDERGEIEAPYTLTIRPDGHISLADHLAMDRWYTLRFEWDLAARTCVVFVDDVPTVYLKQAYREPMGVNYLRIRSSADQVDTAGLLIESVSVEIASS